MSESGSDRVNGHDDSRTELDDRTERALTEYLSVLPDTGRAAGADDLFLVVSQSGSEYLVDTRLGACECPDHEHRDARCKHLRRVAFATGAEAVPAGVEGVDPQLCEHVDGAEPTTVATDGGRLQRPESEHERTRVPVAGGVLVFEPRDLGKELVGFESVDDWDGVRSALSARGLDIGAIHHLPVLSE